MYIDHMLKPRRGGAWGPHRQGLAFAVLGAWIALTAIAPLCAASTGACVMDCCGKAGPCRPGMSAAGCGGSAPSPARDPSGAPDASLKSFAKKPSPAVVQGLHSGVPSPQTLAEGEVFSRLPAPPDPVPLLLLTGSLLR